MLNVEHYGGRVKLVTLTPAGQDLLPFGDGHRVIANERVPLVEWIYREVWNHSAQARASRLFEAAQRAADRWVRRMGWKGQLPRQLGNVRAEQKRGVWHFHYLLPFESPIETAWSRTVERFMHQAWRNDQARFPDEDQRRELIWREYVAGEVTRGFYGFGFAHSRNRAGRSGRTASGYMARNAAGYMAENVAGRGRHYVSARLIRETGVSMRALRACNWLYVRRKLIDGGELEDELFPTHWSDEWRAKVAVVWSQLQPRGP